MIAEDNRERVSDRKGLLRFLAEEGSLPPIDAYDVSNTDASQNSQKPDTAVGQDDTETVFPTDENGNASLVQVRELLAKLKKSRAQITPKLQAKISSVTQKLQESRPNLTKIKDALPSRQELLDSAKQSAGDMASKAKDAVPKPEIIDLYSAKQKANDSLKRWIKWGRDKSQAMRTTLPGMLPRSSEPDLDELANTEMGGSETNDTEQERIFSEKAKELVDKMKGSVPWQTLVLTVPSIAKGVAVSVAKKEAKGVVTSALSNTLEVGSAVPGASAAVATIVEGIRLLANGSESMYKSATQHTAAATFSWGNSERTGSESEAEHKKNKKEGRFRVPSRLLRKIAVAMNAFRSGATQVGMGVTRDRSKVSKMMDAIEQAGGRFDANSEDVQFKLKEAIREKELSFEDIIVLGKRLGRLRAMGKYGDIDVYGKEGAKGIRAFGKDWLDNSVNAEHTPEKMQLFHEALNAVVHDETFWHSLRGNLFTDAKMNFTMRVSELQTDWDKEYLDIKRKGKDLAGKALALAGTAVGTFMMAKAAGTIATLLADKIDDIDVDAWSAKVHSVMEQVNMDEIVNSAVKLAKSETEVIGNLAKLATDEVREQASYIAMAGSAKMHEARETLTQLQQSVQEKFQSTPVVTPRSTSIPKETPEPSGTPTPFERAVATPEPVPASEPLQPSSEELPLSRPLAYSTPEATSTPTAPATSEDFIPRSPIVTPESIARSELTASPTPFVSATPETPIRPTVPATPEPTVPFSPSVPTSSEPSVSNQIPQVGQPEINQVNPIQPTTVRPDTVNSSINAPGPQEPLEAFNRPPVVPAERIQISLPGIENLAPNDRVPYNAIYQTISNWVEPDRLQGNTNVATKFYHILNSNIRVGTVTPDAGFALWNGADLPDSLPSGAVAFFPTTEQLRALTQNVDAMLKLTPTEVQALTGEQRELYDVVTALNSGVNTEQVLQQIAQDDELKAQVLSLAREG